MVADAGAPLVMTGGGSVMTLTVSVTVCVAALMPLVADTLNVVVPTSAGDLGIPHMTPRFALSVTQTGAFALIVQPPGGIVSDAAKG